MFQPVSGFRCFDGDLATCPQFRLIPLLFTSSELGFMDAHPPSRLVVSLGSFIPHVSWLNHPKSLFWYLNKPQQNNIWQPAPCLLVPSWCLVTSGTFTANPVGCWNRRRAAPKPLKMERDFRWFSRGPETSLGHTATRPAKFWRSLEGLPCGNLVSVGMNSVYESLN